jgi:hypothetical protein
MSEEKKNLLLSLYGELDSDDYRVDSRLQREAEQLRYVKFYLDARPRVRPTPEAIEAIVDRAVAADSGPAGIPMETRHGGLRLVKWAARLAASMVIVAVAWIAWPTGAPDPGETGSLLTTVPETVPPASTEAEPMKATVPPAIVAATEIPAVRERLAVQPAAVEAPPGWDDTGELLAIQRRLEMLGALDWDEPPVPLEQLPTRMPPGVNRGVIQARDQ